MFNNTQIIDRATERYIRQRQPLPDEETSAYEVVMEINKDIASENANQPENNKFSLIKDIPDGAVAKLISAREDVALIAPGDRSQSVIFCGQFNTCPSVPLPTPAFALV